MKQLSKTFDWNVTDILEAKSVKESWEKAYTSFEHLIKYTACFDSFSEKVKIHRLAQIERTYADKIGITPELAKNKLLNEFFKNTPKYYDVGVEGYEREDLEEPPLPVSEEVEKTSTRAGYVLPDGTFYGCHFEGHYDLCNDLVRLGTIPKTIESHLVYAYPEDNGWLKVSELQRLKFKFDFSSVKATSKQDEFVQRAMKLFTKNNFDLNDKTVTSLI